MKWCIAMVDFKHLGGIGKGLNRLNIKHELGIPTVTILRKRFKNKEHFEKIPLMFNYGFIKLPNKVAANRDKLLNIRDNVPGIFSWLFKNDDSGYQVEIVGEHIVKRLIALSHKISIFSKSDLSLIKSGDMITLKGYPFDGLQAEIVQINEKTNKVKVNLFIMEAHRQVTVDFENIFYSIYSNFDESISHNSIDEIESQFKNSFDRFQRKKISI
jgi:transcription antitermination factor NusG